MRPEDKQNFMDIIDRIDRLMIYMEDDIRSIRKELSTLPAFLNIATQSDASEESG